MPRIKFVSFYSEGKPYDKGLDLSRNRKIIESNARNYVDTAVFYKPRILKEKGLGRFVKEFKIRGVVAKNPGMNNVGFCAWRPKIILDELSLMATGDILVYRDINATKYPVLGEFKDIKEYAIHYLNSVNFDVFVPAENNENKVVQFAKKNVIDELSLSSRYSNNFPLLIANLIIVRKSKQSIDLLEQWEQACLNDKYIDGRMYGLMNEEFKWSTPEQSILSVLISNYVFRGKDNIVHNYPMFYFKGRDYTKPVPLLDIERSKLIPQRKLLMVMHTFKTLIWTSIFVFCVDVLKINKIGLIKNFNIKFRRIFLQK